MALTELEKELEDMFRTWVKLKLGGMVLKLAPTTAGMPDRLVILPYGRMFLIELKTETGRLSPIQAHWHTRAKMLGSPVTTLYGEAQIAKWVEDHNVPVPIVPKPTKAIRLV